MKILLTKCNKWDNGLETQISLQAILVLVFLLVGSTSIYSQKSLSFSNSSELHSPVLISSNNSGRDQTYDVAVSENRVSFLTAHPQDIVTTNFRVEHIDMVGNNLSGLNRDFDFWTGVFFRNATHLSASPSGNHILISNGGRLGFWERTDSWNLIEPRWDFNAAGFDSNAGGSTFSSDGKKLYIVGRSSNRIFQFSLVTPYSPKGGFPSDDGVRLTLDMQGNTPLDIEFNNDGTKLFVLGVSPRRLYQYSVSEPFDLSSTVAYDDNNIDLPSNTGGFSMSSDGTDLYTQTGFSTISNYRLFPQQQSEKNVGFIENPINDGSVNGSVSIILKNEQFVNPGGTLTYGTHFSIEGLPDGLEPQIHVANVGYVAKLTLSGQARNHDRLNSIPNLRINFQNAAFVGGNAGTVAGAQNVNHNVRIDFVSEEPAIRASTRAGEVLLSWSPAQSDEVVKYRIYRKQGASEVVLTEVQRTFAGIDTTYTDTEVLPGEVHTYRLMGLDVDGNEIELMSSGGNILSGPTHVVINKTGYNGAALFDGQNSSITILSDSLQRLRQGTIDFWIKIDESPAGKNNGFYMIANKLDKVGNSGWLFYHNENEFFARFRSQGGDVFTFESGISLIDSAWHHIALSYDISGTGVSTLYVDGGQVASLSNVELDIVDNLIRIGEGRGTFWTDFEGQVDQFRIWDHSKSSEQVMELSQAGNQLVDQGGLVMEHDFDVLFENTGAIDSGPYQMHGSVSGNVTIVPREEAIESQVFCYARDREVEVNWTLSDYTNVSSFRIYRSGNRVSESVVATVTDFQIGAMNSWTDNTVTDGSWYKYKVFSVDSLGTESFIGSDHTVPNRSFGRDVYFGNDVHYLAIPDHPYLRDSTGTIDFWMRLVEDSALSGNGFTMIANKLGDDGSDGWSFYHDGDQFVAQMKSGPINYNILTGVNLVDGNFHHIAMAYDFTGTDTTRVYIDGQEVANMAGIDLDISADNPLLLGAAEAPFWSDFSGEMDEFRIWDHPLDEVSIREVWLDRMDGSAAGLITVLNMDEPYEALMAYDGTANGINAKRIRQIVGLTDANMYLEANENSIAVNWSISDCSNISSFVVYRRQEGQEDRAVIRRAVNCSTNASDRITSRGLPPGVLYEYYVVAEDEFRRELMVGTDQAVVNGTFGRSASFAGYDDFIAIQDHPAFRDSTGTIEFRVRMKQGPSDQGNGFMMIANKLGDDGSDGWSFYHDRGQFVAQMKSGPTNYNILTGVNLIDSMWHHVAMSYDFAGANATKLYIDGAEVASLAGIDLDISADNPTLIGAAEAAFWDDFNGEIDEFRIWDHPFSQEQIDQFKDRRSNGTQGGLVLVLNLDEPNGSRIVNDGSPNNFNGSVQGEVSFGGNTPPYISSFQQFSIDENTPVGTIVGQVIAEDLDGDSLSGWQWPLWNSPYSQIQINDQGQFFVSDQLNAEMQDRLGGSITVSDGMEEATPVSIIIYINDINEPPYQSSPLPDISLFEEFGEYSIDISDVFEDEDQGDMLTFQATSSDQNVVTLALSGDQLLLQEVNIGTAIIEITATDEDSLQAISQFIVTVENIPNRPPVLDQINNQTINENEELTLLVTATDPDEGQQLSYALDSISINLGMSINAAGQFRWVPGETEDGTYQVEVTVQDDGDGFLTDTEVFEITVNEVNESPTIEPVPDFNIRPDSTLNIRVEAADLDVPHQTLVYSLDEFSLASGISINEIGEITWTPTVDDLGTEAEVTVTVSDGEMEESESFRIFVEGALLLVSVIDQQRPFGESNPAFELNFEGFQQGDNQLDLQELPVVETNATLDSPVGSYPVTITGGKDEFYIFQYQQGALTIIKADQIITFPDMEDFDLAATATVTLSATSNTGLPISYRLDQGDGSISGNTLTINSTGSFTVVALQEGNENYNAASISRSFVATDSRKENQSITFEAIPDKVYGDAPFNVSASTTSGLTVSYSVSGPASLSGSELTLTGAGQVTITADQPGNEQFNPASPVEQTFTIQKAALTVTADDRAITYGEDLPALTFSYSGFVNGEEASVLDEEPQASTTAGPDADAGTYPITLSGGSDENYAFSFTEGTLTIGQASQAIAFEQIADVDFADQTSVSLSASASSGLDVAYTLIQGEGSIDGNTLTIHATGSFVVEASQAGNSNYLPAESVTQSFFVSDSRKDPQSISFDPVTEAIYGDQISLSATATSGMEVSYVLISGEGSIENEVLTLTGTGTYEVRAVQPGNDVFNPAEPVTISFDAGKASLTVTATDQAITEGDPMPELEMSFDGFKLDDDTSAIDELPAIATEATAQSPAGNYEIVLSGGSDDHYELTLVNGLLTIQSLQDVLSLDSEQTEISVYPNPFTKQIMIRSSGSLQAHVYSANGTLLHSSRGNKVIEMYLKDLSAGSYLLKIVTENHVETRLIIKR